MQNIPDLYRLQIWINNTTARLLIAADQKVTLNRWVSRALRLCLYVYWLIDLVIYGRMFGSKV